MPGVDIHAKFVMTAGKTPGQGLASSFGTAQGCRTTKTRKIEMVIMTRWDAFHDLRGAQDQMNEIHKLLAQLRGQQASQSGTGATSAPAWAPPVDIAERQDAYVVTV